MRVAIFMKTGCSKCLRLATFGEHHLGVQRLHFGKAKKGWKLHNHVASGKFKIRSDTVQTSRWRVSQDTMGVLVSPFSVYFSMFQ